MAHSIASGQINFVSYHHKSVSRLQNHYHASAISLIYYEGWSSCNASGVESFLLFEWVYFQCSVYVVYVKHEGFEINCECFHSVRHEPRTSTKDLRTPSLPTFLRTRTYILGVYYRIILKSRHSLARYSASFSNKVPQQLLLRPVRKRQEITLRQEGNLPHVQS